MITTFIMLMLASGQSAAAIDDGQGSSLFAACKANVRIMDRTYKNLDDDIEMARYCTGYLEGFMTGEIYAGSKLCFTDTSPGTLTRIYVAYMESHLKLLDEPKYSGVHMALSEAFHCKMKK